MRTVLCVTNDIATDRRVLRIAQSLMKANHNVKVIGRRYKNCMRLEGIPFHTYRMSLLFRRGPLFYAEYNFRLFVSLLFMRVDALVANDLDSLPAVYLVSKIRRKVLIYDSHEYFTEIPELINREKVRNIWLAIERLILPDIHYAYTVSHSIAASYKEKYGIAMSVIRNLPCQHPNEITPKVPLRSGDEKIILYQGSLNKGRGLELAIRTVARMHHTKLIIIGTGDIEKDLKKLVYKMRISDRVTFLGRIPPAELMQYTIQADIGISMEENAGLNYCYALPNKLFDYIQARIPVLVSDLPEMASLVNRFELGVVKKSDDPRNLAQVFQEMLQDKGKRSCWKKNLDRAAKELCWENEEKKLISIYQKALNKKHKVVQKRTETGLR